MKTSTSSLLRTRLVLSHGLVAMVSASACALETGAGDALSVDVNAQAVQGGTPVTKRGVIALVTDAGGCTGSLLNASTILTAAHCVPGSTSGTVAASVVYDDPDTGMRCLRGGDVIVTANAHPECDISSYYEAHVIPRPEGTDDDTDMAILVSSVDFADVDESDFVYMDTDELGGVDRLETYGYGANSPDWTGAGVLRRGSGQIHSYERYRVTLEAGGARTCKGDSGGPATIYFNQTDPKLNVVAVTSGTDIETGEACAADDGTTERFARLSARVSWIEQELGYSCVADSVGGRNVKRCF